MVKPWFILWLTFGILVSILGEARIGLSTPLHTNLSHLLYKSVSAVSGKAPRCLRSQVHYKEYIIRSRSFPTASATLSFIMCLSIYVRIHSLISCVWTVFMHSRRLIVRPQSHSFKFILKFLPLCYCAFGLTSSTWTYKLQNTCVFPNFSKQVNQD